MSPLAETEAAYLAGILDGEGCLSFAGRGQGRYITPFVQVSNTRYTLLAWLLERFGGRIYPNKELRPNRKQSWVWAVAGQKALTVVRIARPYMLLKTDHADILLSLKRYNAAAKRDALGRISGKLTDEARAENLALAKRIRLLNQRGPHAIN